MDNNFIIPKKSLYNWIGGKNWLKADITKILFKELKDKEVTTYIEPFLGGMGSFKAIMSVLQHKEVKELILNDINPLIIKTLTYIKTDFENVEKLYIKLVNSYIDSFSRSKINSIKFNSSSGKYEEGEYHYWDMQKTKDKVVLKKLFLQEPQAFYKEVKRTFNSDKLNNNINVDTVVKFLFLMTYCFNGIYRENSKGEFNVPFGWGNKPELGLNKVQEFKLYHDLFNKISIIFENMDVFEFLDKYQNKTNSLIYLDPPYANQNGGENKYSKDTFDSQKQKKLLEYTNKFDYVLYSNHNINYIKDFFNKENDVFQIILRKNIMSSKSDNRKNDIEEILVYRNNE